MVVDLTSTTSTTVVVTISGANTICVTVGGYVDTSERAGTPPVTVSLAITIAATEGCSVKVPEVSNDTNDDMIAIAACDGEAMSAL